MKRFGTETAIYGISTILGRFLNFLLVPFYTNVFAPGDYGIVVYVYSLIAFVNVIYSYGMESAYFKYSSTLEIGTAKQNFSTPFISLFGTSIIFSIILAFLASPIARMINVPIDYESILLYTAGILAFDAIAIIPFAALRMEHKAKLFATIKFLNIVINVGMNLILLLAFRMGVIGVFISGLTASVFTVLMLLPTIFRYLTKEFNLPLWKALMKFGLPYIPSGLAAMAIQVIDRPILRALTDDATVGIYQANYRLGIFMMLIVSMYDYAWRPFYFSTAKEVNAKEIFARVLTYLVLFMSAIFLVLTFFIGDIAKISIFGRHIIGPSYWSGLDIVPIVLLGYVFLGIFTNLSAGIFIEKKTKYSPLVTGIGAAVNVAANFLLIPPFGMLGAAWATFLAYFIMALTMYFVVQRIYPVRYEFSRLFKVAGSAAVVILLYYFIPAEKLFNSMTIVFLWKVFLIVFFLLLMYVMKFFKAGEISVIKKLWNRREEKGSSDISDSI
ncbi:MAG: polysaccharide biosynthesis C-terminal domain-containing protein [Bacteroidota bacterium]|nr:polysaccharide biosynthesis C-terminal domain-containing protein [Bacteroidota bacterium]